jgi:conjugal transfer pilus assembly protein TraV
MKPFVRKDRTRKSASFIALATLLLSSGCATLLGGNVKGNFACSAPGGTCAPTQVIDDQALSDTTDGSLTPAADKQDSQLNGYQRTAVGAPPPLRTGERVLRIVFPPRIDRFGRYREAVAIHAVVATSAWAERRDPAIQAATLIPQPDAGLAALAATAPNLGLGEISEGEDSGELVPASQRLGDATNSLISPVSDLSPAADAKRKVEALFGGQSSRSVPAPLKSKALPASLVQSNMVAAKPVPVAAQPSGQAPLTLKAGSFSAVPVMDDEK